MPRASLRLERTQNDHQLLIGLARRRGCDRSPLPRRDERGEHDKAEEDSPPTRRLHHRPDRGRDSDDCHTSGESTDYPSTSSTSTHHEQAEQANSKEEVRRGRARRTTASPTVTAQVERFRIDRLLSNHLASERAPPRGPRTTKGRLRPRNTTKFLEEPSRISPRATGPGRRADKHSQRAKILPVLGQKHASESAKYFISSQRPATAILDAAECLDHGPTPSLPLARHGPAAPTTLQRPARPRRPGASAADTIRWFRELTSKLQPSPTSDAAAPATLRRRVQAAAAAPSRTYSFPGGSCRTYEPLRSINAAHRSSSHHSG